MVTPDDFGLSEVEAGDLGLDPEAMDALAADDTDQVAADATLAPEAQGAATEPEDAPPVLFTAIYERMVEKHGEEKAAELASAEYARIEGLEEAAPETVVVDDDPDFADQWEFDRLTAGIEAEASSASQIAEREGAELQRLYDQHEKLAQSIATSEGSIRTLYEALQGAATAEEQNKIFADIQSKTEAIGRSKGRLETLANEHDRHLKPHEDALAKQAETAKKHQAAQLASRFAQSNPFLKAHRTLFSKLFVEGKITAETPPLEVRSIMAEELVKQGKPPLTAAKKTAAITPVAAKKPEGKIGKAWSEIQKKLGAKKIGGGGRTDAAPSRPKAAAADLKSGDSELDAWYSEGNKYLDQHAKAAANKKGAK